MQCYASYIVQYHLANQISPILSCTKMQDNEQLPCSTSLPCMQMFVQGEQRGQHLNLHDQPNVSSLNLSAEQHASVPGTPYSKQNTRVLYESNDTLVMHYYICFCSSVNQNYSGYATDPTNQKFQQIFTWFQLVAYHTTSNVQIILMEHDDEFQPTLITDLGQFRC